MYEKIIISKCSRLLLVLFTTNIFADNLSYNQDQAIQNTMKKIDINKIQEQQRQVNQDNQLAAKIYQITSIPSWRTKVFINNARTTQGINTKILINQLDSFLISNDHSGLTELQKKKITEYIKYNFL